MTQPWVVDNNCVKHYRYPTQLELWPGQGVWLCVHCDLDLDDMSKGQFHDTPFGHG